MRKIINAIGWTFDVMVIAFAIAAVYCTCTFVTAKCDMDKMRLQGDITLNISREENMVTVSKHNAWSHNVMVWIEMLTEAFKCEKLERLQRE